MTTETKTVDMTEYHKDKVDFYGCNPCVKCRYAYARGGIVCCSAYKEVFKLGELPQKPCPRFKGYLPSNIIVFETYHNIINSLGKSKEI